MKLIRYATFAAMAVSVFFSAAAAQAAEDRNYLLATASTGGPITRLALLSRHW